MRSIAYLSLVLLLVPFALATAPGPHQSGTGATCLSHFNLVGLKVQTDSVVTVRPHTHFVATSDISEVKVDFYDRFGNWQGNGGWSAERGDLTPRYATWGIVCTYMPGPLIGLAIVPVPAAEWTYQDGLG